MRIQQNRPGMMLLTTVLVIGSVALVIALSVASRGIHELGMGYGSSQGLRALGLAEGCVYESLVRLARDTNYTGGEIEWDDGTCTITVNESGSQRTVVSTATVGSWTKVVTATLELSGRSITVTEWRQGL